MKGEAKVLPEGVVTFPKTELQWRGSFLGLFFDFFLEKYFCEIEACWRGGLTGG